ncbi:MAG: sterol desaturase family protein [Sinimarinibacterium flocculans]|uniref:sterol desaturase family protein n=1 Tax=Sinimarinibacterium flocculans TaxID=985250 RepID=UPI00249283D1|nr:sterol desaturase family protein [Sinimarinibacterium flocculans]MEC9358981.1 sterol desaturase family protein [Pseudomonadota bacterium]
MTLFIRYGAYPAIAGGACALLIVLAGAGIAYWPAFPLIVLAGIAVVAALERVAPYEPDWNRDHDGDTRVDLLHLLVSYLLIQFAVILLFGLRAWRPDWASIWPEHWSMWAQVALAGPIMDLGLYAMHRASHASGLLWRLHAIHHSPLRLYWLNGGRRHPFSALLLAGPGLLALMALGATPVAVGAWLSFMSIHLAFQHANLDYRLGPLRHLLGVAEMHRWHHKRDFEDAQVNFGEVLLIWDRLFGTFYDAARSPGRGDVGLRDDAVPRSYLGQLLWPLKTAPDRRAE